ncbi:MAG: FkbM family methyltransferase [Verrucomicrobiota bacterium]
MHLFTFTKRILERIGIRAYRTSNLPRNIDLFHDLKHISFQPKVIFDVGANVGVFAQSAISAFPQASIHSFEPVSTTFASLKQVANRHSNLQIHNLAFGAEPGESIIHLREKSVWNSLLPFNNDTRNSSGKSETIQISTIDSFCADNHILRIDLLKTDTEGFDTKVLAGADQMFRELRVGAVFTEVTFLKNDLTHTPFLEIFEFLGAHGFILYGIYEFAGDFETMHANALFIHNPRQSKSIYQ